jgi:hypothetical protein
MKVLRPLVALVTALSSMLIGAGTVSASASAAKAFTCHGTITSPGVVAPGTYSSLKIAGFCVIIGGLTTNVIVRDDVTVEKGATLLANYPAFPPLLPAEGDANVIVKGNIFVREGATLFLGCEAAAGCVNPTFDAVGGKIVSDGALGVRLHSDIIGGSVDLLEGGGGVNCNARSVFPFGVSTDVEDNVIGGSLHVAHLKSCWFGEFRNFVMGNDTVDHNTFANEDATEVGSNEVFGNLSCFDNNPVAQFGDSGALPNIVLGKATGECAALL